MGKIKTFRDLVIWQKSLSLVTEIYRLTSRFPHQEEFVMISQIRRNAISIPRNIAEGFGRKSKLEFKRFLRIAAGSLFELQTQLDISLNLNYIDLKDYQDILALSREIERMISAFENRLKIHKS
ncbi:MAG: four helix bundle protein [Candidatus Glassbacteria bacterium]